MEIVSFIPGATTAGDAITITTGSPDIDAVVAAEIERVPTALAAHPAADIVAGLANHTGANILGAIANHPDTDIRDALADHSAILLAACFDNHTQAQVVNAIADHAVHPHDLQVQAGASVEAFGATGAGVSNLSSASGQNIPGGVVATGIQDYITPAHAAGVGPLVHAGVADLAHVAGAAPVAHTVGGAPVVHGAGVDVTHAGASPVVAGVPTKGTTRTITLSVDTLLGDILTLFYLAVGERVPAS